MSERPALAAVILNSRSSNYRGSVFERAWKLAAFREIVATKGIHFVKSGTFNCTVLRVLHQVGISWGMEIRLVRKFAQKQQLRERT